MGVPNNQNSDFLIVNSPYTLPPGPKYSNSELEDLVVMLMQDYIPTETVDHSYSFTEDGDGWNEPMSEYHECHCGEWEVSWVQTSRDCEDRPQLVDIGMQWRKHVNECWEKDNGVLPQD